MNKMKRLLALVICLLLTVTSLPVTQLVFADDTATETTTEPTASGWVAYQETTFKSADEITWSKASTKGYFTDYATASVDENGYYTLTQTATIGATTSGVQTQAYAKRDLNQNLVAKDDENRTQVVADAFNGKFDIELDLDVLIKKQLFKIWFHSLKSFR